MSTVPTEKAKNDAVQNLGYEVPILLENPHSFIAQMQQQRPQWRGIYYYRVDAIHNAHQKKEKKQQKENIPSVMSSSSFKNAVRIASSV